MSDTEEDEVILTEATDSDIYARVSENGGVHNDLLTGETTNVVLPRSLNVDTDAATTVADYMSREEWWTYITDLNSSSRHGFATLVPLSQAELQIDTPYSDRLLIHMEPDDRLRFGHTLSNRVKGNILSVLHRDAISEAIGNMRVDYSDRSPDVRHTTEVRDLAGSSGGFISRFSRGEYTQAEMNCEAVHAFDRNRSRDILFEIGDNGPDITVTNVESDFGQYMVQAHEDVHVYTQETVNGMVARETMGPESPEWYPVNVLHTVPSVEIESNNPDGTVQEDYGVIHHGCDSLFADVCQERQ